MVDAGEAWCCEIRCINPGGRWIRPGSNWHLAHGDDGEYRGPSHDICNCSEAGRRGNPKGRPKRRLPRWRPSVQW